MKKTTILAVALAAGLGYSSAWAAEVVSSNVVGYQKLSIPANGYALLANPFVQVGTGSSEEPAGYAINDMFADDADNSTAGRTAGLGDQMQVWDTATQGYTTYFYSSWVNKWALNSTPRAATTDSFEAGDGYWYLNRGDSEYNLTVSGEVSTGEVDVTLAPGYTLVCNPFPADLPLNGESVVFASEGATAGRTAGLGDNIQIWDVENQGYTTYFYSSWVSKWALNSTPRAATADSIPAGQGFWYLNRGDSDITITLKSPLAADAE